MIGLALVVLFQVASGSPHTGTPATTASNSPTGSAAPAPNSPTPVIRCRMVAQPNSRLEKRVCVTAAQDDAQLRNGQAAMQDLSAAQSIADTKQ